MHYVAVRQSVATLMDLNKSQVVHKNNDYETLKYFSTNGVRHAE